jgi:hypothetical protein
LVKNHCYHTVFRSYFIRLDDLADGFESKFP